jgi:hypothetical protein
MSTHDATTASALAVRPNLNVLMEKAMTAGPEGVQMLKELVALSREVQADAAREAFHDAMRAFQSECPAIHKNKQVGGAGNSGGSMQYRYADLEQIVSTVRPIMDRHGLSFSFNCAVTDAGVMTATCVVRHTAGHSEASSFTCPAGGGNTRVNVQQQAGGAYTFARRYALIGALGLATTDDDTDGRETQRPDAERLSDQQSLELDALIHDTGADLKAFLNYFKVARLDDLPASEFGRAKAMLARKAKAGTR